MKSIMEEGSTVLKAIERGLIKAGNPKEFSVKIYEEAEKNFFGLTTKPAKIGIFFDDFKEKKYASEGSHQSQKNSYTKSTGPAASNKHIQKPGSPIIKAKPIQEHPKQKSAQKDHSTKSATHKVTPSNIKSLEKTDDSQNKPLWTPEMINYATEWINQMLKQTEFSHVPFSINADKYYLKINFASPICQDITKERQLFASISLLLMQGVKKKFENSFKGYKAILMRNETSL